MPFLNNKNRLAYLTSLTLLFSYAELFLPRIIPFFRLGLGNIVLLSSFDLNFKAYFILILLKSLTSNLMAGTLFSPFMLISFFQSLISGIAMYMLFKINQRCKNKLFSIYGLSLTGSALSALIQIYLSSLYLGSGTLKLLGPMLLFNLISGIITAFFADFLKIPQKAPVFYEEEKNTNLTNQWKQKIGILLLLITVFAVFFISNLYILSLILVFSVILQKFFHRKITILPHLYLWIFIIISSLLVQEGKVLIKIADFSITEGALLEGISKALKLSSVSALSQCAAGLKPSESSLTGLSLNYYRRLSILFKNTPGNIINRLKITLSAENL